MRMSPETPFLDPEVKELVREVLADPKAKLLSARSVADFPARAAFLEPVRPSAIGLTTAERHLLRAYREEVAWILRNAAARALLEGPGQRPLTYVSESRSASPAPCEELVRRAAQAQESRFRLTITEGEASALGVVGTGGAPRVARYLARISLQLVPCDSARVCMAYASIQEGAFIAADELLQRVIESTSSETSRSVAHENLGLSLVGQGRVVEACDAYSRACGAGPPRPSPLMDLLITECMRGDLVAARRTAERLDTLFTPEHPGVSEKWSGVRLELLADDTKQSLLHMRESVGETSRRLIDEATA